MKRLTGFLVFFLSVSAFAEPAPLIEFDCVFKDWKPYERCHLVEWQHDIPVLGLEDLGLTKQITYYYQGTPTGKCPPKSIRLQAVSGEQRFSFGLVDPTEFSFVVMESTQPVIIQIIDEKPGVTLTKLFYPECRGEMTYSQTYTLASLETKKNEVVARLGDIGREISAFSEMIDLCSKTDVELQAKLDEIQGKIAAIKATLATLEEKPPPNMDQIREQLNQAKAELEGTQGELKNVKSMDLNGRAIKISEYTNQRAQAVSRGSPVREHARRLINYLSGRFPDLEAAASQYDLVLP